MGWKRIVGIIGLVLIMIVGGIVASNWKEITYSKGKYERVVARAIASHNVEVCSKLPGNYCPGIFCMNPREPYKECIVDTAIVLKDPSLCIAVSETAVNFPESERQSCLRDLAMETGDIQFCDGKAYCREHVSIASLQYGYCEREKNGCIENVAFRHNKPEYCYSMENISGGPNQDGCLYQIALTNINDNLCNQISSISIKESCINGVNTASEKFANNSATCEQKGAERDDCYFRFARENRRAKYCEPILDKAIQDDCFKRVFAG